MQILFCAAEVVPFAKVGGLSDVVGSLPKELVHLGLKPAVVMPRYGCVDVEAHKLADTGLRFQVKTEETEKSYEITLLKSVLPGTEVPVYFLDCPTLYGASKDVYPKGNYDLELEYFRVLTLAVPELMKTLDYYPDILHLHDWHTARLAVRLKELRKSDSKFKNIKSILTIHNLAYQGWDGGDSWLKQGIESADYLTTVSPTYAKEIQTAEFGEKVEDLLSKRADHLVGILNGIDTELFNPASDKFITKQFDAKTVATGKAACKEALQKEFDLPLEPNVPLMGFVSRLVDQKGLDILMPALRDLHGENIQWVILGTGDPKYEEELKSLNSSCPHVRSFIGFNLALAQKIYAGCDMFLMPSRFEPCGLGQLIALRYGSVPVVRHVGGLTDTVFDVRTDEKHGNGFCFNRYEAKDLEQLIRAAVDLYGDQNRWAKLVQRGMTAELGWDKSARDYKALYEKVRQAVAV